MTKGIVWTIDASGTTAHAHYGGLRIGTAGEREDGSAYWSIDAVHMKWIAKGRDLHAANIAAATLALDRAWGKFLSEAKLAIAPGQYTNPDPIWGRVLPSRPKSLRNRTDGPAYELSEQGKAAIS